MDDDGRRIYDRTLLLGDTLRKGCKGTNMVKILRVVPTQSNDDERSVGVGWNKDVEELHRLPRKNSGITSP